MDARRAIDVHAFQVSPNEDGRVYRRRSATVALGGSISTSCLPPRGLNGLVVSRREQIRHDDDSGSMQPWSHGVMTPWSHTMVPSSHGSDGQGPGPWNHGPIETWSR